MLSSFVCKKWKVFHKKRLPEYSVWSGERERALVFSISHIGHSHVNVSDAYTLKIFLYTKHKHN